MEVKGRIEACSVSRSRTAVRRGAGIASNTLGNDRHQAQLQIGSPTEGPEEELFGALDCERNGIDCRYGAHWKPFPGALRTKELRKYYWLGSVARCGTAAHQASKAARERSHWM